ncbi:MAG: 50S ribosomal protein L24, partial [Oscillospiraceae bacterium]
AKRHLKPRKPGETGGIIKKETPIYASKVMRVCPKCDKPTREAHLFLKDGSKVRVCKKCGETI